MSDIIPLFYSTGDAAVRLGFGLTKVRQLIRDGKLDVVMHNGRVLVTEAGIQKFAATRATPECARSV